ncbi:hypothetical protein [Nocardioides lianchengensis]|uniref:N-acetyltransferase domain-containing protein n=1 Tax=Nocardioides lianchengensis TaxID=1045774 RepID=A0A1G6RMI4_9ACTN|nr:hypothetical protein [Nocardioides lianchengensis]NYG10180.1 hypothetical protein [Nocardioides lianchengensis]SDD05880.1 hypothetical protein SAMN05421872_105340 [Nocardioides lianchengensis]
MPDTPRPELPVRISVETDVDAETAATYYRLYVETFGHLATKAVARQLLHEDEFLEEMHDPRVSKYVAWDGDDVIGLTTLTKHLETVPWISPAYFEHHYPEQWARDAVYYLGVTLVAKSRRESHVFQAMIAACTELILRERAVCAWDMCFYNDEELGLGPAIRRMLDHHPELQVAPIDRQTYFAAVFSPPA